MRKRKYQNQGMKNAIKLTFLIILGILLYNSFDQACTYETKKAMQTGVTYSAQLAEKAKR